MPTSDDQPISAHGLVRWVKVVAALFGIAVGFVLFASPAGADEGAAPRDASERLRTAAAVDRVEQLATTAVTPASELLAPASELLAPASELVAPTLEAATPVVRAATHTVRPVADAVAPVAQAIAPVAAPVVDLPELFEVVDLADGLETAGPSLDALQTASLRSAEMGSAELVDPAALAPDAPAISRPAVEKSSPAAVDEVDVRAGSRPIAHPAGPASDSQDELSDAARSSAPVAPVRPTGPATPPPAPAPAASNTVAPHPTGERPGVDAFHEQRAAAARGAVVSTVRLADGVVPVAPAGDPPVSPD